MTEHIVELVSERHRARIEQYLANFIDPSLPIWIISSGTFQKIKFPKIAPKITGYNITTLILSNNSYPNIVRDLGRASFQYLLVLNLSNNSIASTEPLLWLFTPYLEALYLDKNLITNLKSLRKFIGKSLKILDVSMNQLVDINYIQEFNCPNLKQLTLYRNQAVTFFEPYLKANFNPPHLVLLKMGFLSHTAKKDFIDFALRRPLNGEVARTKI